MDRRGFLFGLAGLSGAAQAMQETGTGYVPPVPNTLEGWRTQGQADFSIAEFEGRKAVRIRVPGDAELEYQQVRFDITKDVLPGDGFRVGATVRTTDVQDGTGAYIVVEFLNAEGERVGIAHSPVIQTTGSRGWDRLIAEGKAPKDTTVVRLSLILHAHATAYFTDLVFTRVSRDLPWPELGGALRTATIQRDRPITDRFRGTGFHAFQHAFPATDDEMNTVIYKRWRELNPAFVRVNHDRTWEGDRLAQVAKHLRAMQATDCEIYLTTWNPPDARTPEEYAAFAQRVADHITFFQQNDVTIHWYCMTNELSLEGWGKLAQDLPRFKAFHQALFTEFQKRGLKVGLLATDASPLPLWHTIEWAAKNMDPITAIYGGHHYINDQTPDDERFYPWFLTQLKAGADIAQAKGKDFILGEFGAKQDGRVINGVTMDSCVYWDTPMEPMVGIQLAEAAIASMNAGLYALGYWTFMDFPDRPWPGYENKWGLFQSGKGSRGWKTRAPYYAYGLLTRFFRGPATVFPVETADPRLRIAAIRRNKDGAWSIAVVNRNKQPAPLNLRFAGRNPLNLQFRKYVYNPASVPHNAWGDMPPATERVLMEDSVLRDTLTPGTLTVYTTAFKTNRPASVRRLFAVRKPGHIHLTWEGSRSPDIAYYRVYLYAGTDPQPKPPAARLGSTIANEFFYRLGGNDPAHFGVVPVDIHGNAGTMVTTQPISGPVPAPSAPTPPPIRIPVAPPPPGTKPGPE